MTKIFDQTSKRKYKQCFQITQACFKTEVEELMKMLKDLSHAHADLQQHCFPLYFSRSPIDGTKKIVEHIESLK